MKVVLYISGVIALVLIGAFGWQYLTTGDLPVVDNSAQIDSLRTQIRLKDSLLCDIQFEREMLSEDVKSIQNNLQNYKNLYYSKRNSEKKLKKQLKEIQDEIINNDDLIIGYNKLFDNIRTANN